MSRARYRLAHAHAVRVLRQLGRDLTSGDYPRARGELTTGQAVAVIGDAMVTVFKLGVNSVVDAAEDALDNAVRQLLGQVDE